MNRESDSSSGDRRTRGRGAAENPGNRFETVHREVFGEFDAVDTVEDGDSPVRTMLLRDSSKSALTTNSSPDIPFDTSLNPYRGCEHGCAYCYARPTHEYLGFSAGLDFETKILVKERAPELLRKELLAPGWDPRMIVMSGVTDPYQPVERRLKVTRRCLEVLAEFRNPIFLITKNALVTRDADLLGELAKVGAAAVLLSITTLDEELGRVLEPRTSRPAARLEAIRALAEAGVPVGVNVAPVIPGLTDHELAGILQAAKDAGASFAGYGALRLPLGTADLFSAWLDAHRPGSKEKVLGRVRDMRGGKLNDGRFGQRMRAEGPFAEQLRVMFRVTCKRLELNGRGPELSTAAFGRATDQMSLF